MRVLACVVACFGSGMFGLTCTADCGPLLQLGVTFVSDLRHASALSVASSSSVSDRSETECSRLAKLCSSAAEMGSLDIELQRQICSEAQSIKVLYFVLHGTLLGAWYVARCMGMPHGLQCMLHRMLHVAWDVAWDVACRMACRMVCRIACRMVCCNVCCRQVVVFFM